MRRPTDRGSTHQGAQRWAELGGTDVRGPAIEHRHEAPNTEALKNREYCATWSRNCIKVGWGIT
eukprot:scaffold153864_cov31-Tisochrysis_lutea.AAC.3